jgi:hypothetical protein
MPEDSLDAIALAIEAFVVADRGLAVRLRWDHGLDAAPLQIGPDCVGIVSLIGKKRLGLAFG